MVVHRSYSDENVTVVIGLVIVPGRLQRRAVLSAFVDQNRL